MTVPELVRKAAERLYLKAGSVDDDTLVTAWLTSTNNSPKDPKRKGFWVLSLYAQATAKARYKSVAEWLDGKRS